MALQRILCIDDDPDIRTLVEIALSTVAGYDVLVCRSAKDALERIGSFRPDVILLDVMMPECDGPATLCALKERNGGVDFPTIYFTGVADADNDARLSGSGAAAIIAKPFDPLTLGGEIREIYERFTETNGP